ncbi:DUF3617 domain-containing protein [Altererythrobacter sp. ZODW24]|uniref:DUF3617 domain-containing protein n=1 Tax=Altererythrobacter sp. ZODW24 TaxID=2185142 RepID=UPI000DF7EE95|nr:DUF3617 domain-containing protein [Altererythrobacter sp. ZODW24]
MNRITQLAAVSASFALVACGSAQDPDKRAPGQWETSISLNKLELSGMPPEMQGQVDQMKEQMRSSIERMGGAQTQCLTAEASEKEDVVEGFSKMAGTGCEFTKQDVGGGKIDVAGKCNMGGQEMDVTMVGTMTPEKIQMVSTMKSEAETSGVMQKPGLDMEMTTDVVRTGDC